MSGKTYVGNKAAKLEEKGTLAAISRVTLFVDNENYYTSGDDTGRELKKTNPHATQEMADSILNAVRGYQHKPYKAQRAMLDPAAELGDGVTICGFYSSIGQTVVDFGPAYLVEVSAPGSKEVDEEFGSYTSQTEREFNRKIAETRSSITKTAEQIRLEVANEVEGLSSSIDVELDKITQRVEGAEGSIEVAISTLDGLTVTDDNGTVKIKGGAVTADGLYVNAANITGTLTADQIDATNLKVSAANITGALTIGQLPSTVAETSDIPTSTSDLTNDSGFVNRTGVTTIINGTVTTDYVNALGITAKSVSASDVTAGTLSASSLALSGLLELDYNGSEYGYVGASTAGKFDGAVLSDSTLNNYFIATTGGARMSAGDVCEMWVTTGGCYSSHAINVSSDRRLKNSISYGLDEYEPLFEQLKPSVYCVNSETDGRRHFGFIAQDVQRAVSGMVGDLALIGRHNGMLSLGYTELIPLNTYMIQKLMRRVDDINKRLEAAGL